ncbi:MAG: endonuclease III [Candidatus Babeliaceae bacterium]
MDKSRIEKIIMLLEKATKNMEEPMSDLIVRDYGRDPFLILISCLLSLRARDKQTYPICKELFAQARTPQELLKIPTQNLEKLLHPIGFYRRKAHVIKLVSQELLEQFKGQVPKTQEELLSLSGVGHKTANLVLGVAFNIPALCVDTHVHRLSNRLGLVDTKTADETEKVLMKIVPEKYWIKINRLFVMWGQNICVPISPFCSRCILSPICPRKGVIRSR